MLIKTIRVINSINVRESFLSIIIIRAIKLRPIKVIKKTLVSRY